MRRILCSILLICSIATSSYTQSAPPQSRNYPWQYYWQQSLAAYGKKDYAAFLDQMQKAIKAGPEKHPVLLYDLARANSLNGRKAEAVRLLKEVLDLGFGAEAASSSDFAPVRDSDEFKRLLGRIKEVGAPVIRSTLAFTIPEKDLIPEGIAYDPVDKKFYVGGLYKSKIVSIDRDGSRRDFAKENQDGLFGVLGMRVDAGRRILWVNSAMISEMKGFKKENNGISALHKYDLKTGRLIKKYELSNKPSPHLLNDIAINMAGDVFITDSLQSAVYTVSKEKDELELFAKLTPYTYPNGIALSDDGKRLFVADLEGISVVEVATKTVSKLASSPNVALSGIDGLYFHRNSLIGVQNFGGQPIRIVRFSLNAGGDRAERAQVIESNNPLFNIPTTGVIAGSSFYFIANSQLRSFDTQGNIFPLDKLSDVFILKTSI